jgi:hypothetical protein
MLPISSSSDIRLEANPRTPAPDALRLTSSRGKAAEYTIDAQLT